MKHGILSNNILQKIKIFVKYLQTRTEMKYISNLAELDLELKYVESQFAISDDCGRRALSTFCYKIDKESIPKDPFSKEYFEFQRKLYCTLSGRQYYAITNEESIFDLDEIKNRPFPYYTHSASTVGDQLLAIGFIIKNTNLPPKSDIIEFGPGWGNLTLALAQMGHKITCVEVERRFIDLIRYRSKEIIPPVECIQKDMLEFMNTPEKKFDAALFFNSFHHCSDPITLIKKLPAIIHDDGVICFASEPFPKRYSGSLPYPWGIRLDGMSVWSIRKFGWMEFGFDIRFFIKLLSQNGFKTEKIISDVSPLTTLVIARKNR